MNVTGKKMREEGFNIEQEFARMYQGLEKYNGPEKMQLHGQAMKVAFIQGVARMAYLTEKFGNISYQRSEEVKQEIFAQAEAYFDECLAHNAVIDVMSEVNAEFKEKEPPAEVKKEEKKPDPFTIDALKFARKMFIIWIILQILSIIVKTIAK